MTLSVVTAASVMATAAVCFLPLFWEGVAAQCDGNCSQPTNGSIPTTNSSNETSAPTTAPIPCSLDSSDCDVANSAGVLPISDGCVCVCLEHWTGPTCAVCPAQFTPITNCSSCAANRYGSDCDAAAFLTATFTTATLPPDRILLPLAASSVNFWEVAVATSVEAFVSASDCFSNTSSSFNASLIVTTMSINASGNTSDAVLSATVAISLVISSANTTWSAADLQEQNQTISNQIDCVQTALRQFQVMNEGAPCPAGLNSSFCSVLAASVNTSIDSVNPCGVEFCVSSALSQGQPYPPDPAVVAAAAALNASSAQSSSQTLIIVIIVVIVIVILVLIAVAARCAIASRRQARRAERLEKGVSLLHAMANDSAISEMTAPQAAELLRGASKTNQGTAPGEREQREKAESERSLPLQAGSFINPPSLDTLRARSEATARGRPNVPVVASGL